MQPATIFDKSLRATTRAVKLGDVNGGRGYRFFSTLRKVSFLGHHRWDFHVRMAALCND